MSLLERDYNLYFVSKCTTTENDDLETSSSAPGKEVMDRSLTTCNDSNVGHCRKEKSQNEHCNETILDIVINENKSSRRDVIITSDDNESLFNEKGNHKCQQC